MNLSALSVRLYTRICVAAVLALLVVPTATRAQLTISDDQTEAILTSEVGDILIEEGASVTIDQAGAVVTIDSNNSVTTEVYDADGDNVNATISNEAASNATGVYLKPGNSGNLEVYGSIFVGEMDTELDKGANNYGILVGDVSDPEVFTGNITLGEYTTFTVRGDQSVGIAVYSEIAGDLTFDGVVTVLGEDAVGVLVTAPVTGQMTFRGNVITRVDASTSTEEVDPIPSSAVALGASVTGGIYLRGPTEDLDGVTPAQLITVGSAPGMYISPTVAGDQAAEILIGLYSDLDADDPAFNASTGTGHYSFVNRGTVQGVGTEPGVHSEGLRIEGTSTELVRFEGGIYSNGTIGASARSANDAATNVDESPSNATGLVIGRNALIPTLVNDGSLYATTTGTAGGTATALLIEEGGSLLTLSNASSITASGTISEDDLTLDNIEVYAIRDLSGTLSRIDNQGFIEANIDDNATGFSPVAIDVSASSHNVVITNTSTESQAAIIRGDILFGSGPDNELIINGHATDNSGATTRTLVEGSITSEGGAVDIAIVDGILRTGDTRADDITIGQVAPGDEVGSIDFVLSLEPNDIPLVTATGQVQFLEGSRVTISSLSFLPDTGVYKLLTAQGGIQFGDFDVVTAFDSLYLFNSRLVFDDAPSGEDAINLYVERKTADELQLSRNQAVVYEAVSVAATTDDEFGRGLVAISNQGEVEAALNSLQPNSGIGGRALTASVSNSVTGPIGRRQRVLLGSPEQGLRFWAQQFYQDLNAVSSTATTSYFGSGTGVTLGADWGDGYDSRYGLSYTYFSGQVTETVPRSTKQDMALSMVSLYSIQKAGSGFVTPQLNVGYASYDSQRLVVAGPLTRTPISDWSAYLASGGVTAGYVWDAGIVDIVPHISADASYMYETSYSERHGGDAVNLSVDSRASQSARVFAGLIAQTEFDLGGGIFRPQFLVGFSHEFLENDDAINAAFRSVPGEEFSVSGPQGEKSKLIGGVSFHYVFENWSAAIHYDAAQTSGALSQAGTLAVSSRF